MTYAELSQIKTTSMTMNGILDDIINNARFCYTKSAFKKAVVSEYDMKQIREWVSRLAITLPSEFVPLWLEMAKNHAISEYAKPNAA